LEEPKKSTIMRKSLLTVGLAFSSMFLSATNENNFTIISQDENSMIVEYNLDSYTINTLTYSYSNGLKPGSSSTSEIKSDNTLEILEKGFPAVRRASVSLQMPERGIAEVEILEDNSVDLAEINLLPSKGSLKRNVDPATVAHEYGMQYNIDAFYPSNAAQLGSPYIFRNTRGTVLYINPFRYNAITKTLKVSTKVKVKITFNNNVKGENEIYSANHVLEDEKQIAEQHFLNYAVNETRYTPKTESGSMLIISYDSFITDIQSFADWKNQKGIETTIVPVSTVGNNMNSIKTYVQNYYTANPDLLYVLLVGDHAQVNSANAGTAGSEIKWSDSYYGLLTGNDHYPELFVGRFSASTNADIQNMVNRTLEYEKNPLAGNWYEIAIGIGSDQGAGFGDDGEADWQHERNIGTKLTTWGYDTFYEFYDGSQGGNDAAGDPNSTMVANAVNAGASLFFYTGHGAQNVCVTSNYSSSDVAVSNNNGMYPFVVSVACNNGTFTTGSCLAEAFLLAKNTNGPTGSINTVGSSILMAWAEPMQTQDEIIEILTDQYSTNKKYTAGGLFYNAQMSMLDDYPTNTGEDLVETWVMFGDPSILFRTQVPSFMTISHDNCYIPTASTFDVTCSTNGAQVSITQNDVIFGTATVSGGTAGVPITGSLNAADPILITITGVNREIYQQSVTACSASGIQETESLGFSLYPNPAEELLNLSIQSPVNENVFIEIINSIGEVVKTESKNILNGNSVITIQTNDLASGIYRIKLSGNSSFITKGFIKK